MKILKWILLFWSFVIYGQEDSINHKIEMDSLWYQNTQNSFSSSDEFILLGYQDFETSIMGNFGSVLIPFWWKSGSSIEQKIGDRILQTPTTLHTHLFTKRISHILKSFIRLLILMDKG